MSKRNAGHWPVARPARIDRVPSMMGATFGVPVWQCLAVLGCTAAAVAGAVAGWWVAYDLGGRLQLEAVYNANIKGCIASASEEGSVAEIMLKDGYITCFSARPPAGHPPPRTGG